MHKSLRYIRSLFLISVVSSITIGQSFAASYLSQVLSDNNTRVYSAPSVIGAGFSVPLFSDISPLSPSTFSLTSLTDSLASLVKQGPRIAKLNLLPLETYQSFALGGYTVQAQRAPSVTNGNAVSFLDRLSLTVFCSLAANKDASRCSYDNLLALRGTSDTTTVLGYPVEQTPVAVATSTPSTPQPSPSPRVVYVPQYITNYVTEYVLGTPGKDGKDGKDGTTSTLVNNTSIPSGFGSYSVPSVSSPSLLGATTIGYLRDVTIEKATVADSIFNGYNLFNNTAIFTGFVGINSLTATTSVLTNATITTSTTTDAFITNLTSTNNLFTNATTTNSYISSLVASSSTLTDALLTNSTSTNAYIQNLVAASSSVTDALFTNATSTNFVATNATSTSLFAQALTAVSSFFTNLTATNATTTNLIATNATSTNLFAGTGFVTNLTTTAATSTNLFSTNAFFTNLDATNINLGNATTTNFVATNATTTSLFTQNLAVGNATTQGNQTINGDLTVNGTTTIAGNITLGTSTATYVSFNGLINSNVVPAANKMFDLGSPSFYWRDLYADNINVNTISAASTTISGTSNNTFSINSDNASADTEDVSLIFFRGLVTPNALIRWNATAKRLESNMSFKVQNETPITGTTTLTIQAGAGQGTTNLLEVKNVGGTNLTVIDANGRVGIGSSTPSQALTVIGNASIGGNITATGTLDVAGTSTLATTTITQAMITNASTTNLSATGATLTNLFSSVLNAVTAGFTNVTTTNATSTNLFSSVLSAVTGTVNTLTGGSITATSSLVSNGTLNVTGQTTLTTASSTGLTSTNLYGTNATLTNATSTNLFTSLLNAVTTAFTTLTTTGTTNLATGGGNVGVGTTTPTAGKLVVEGGASTGLFVSQTGGSLYTQSAGGIPRLYLGGGNGFIFNRQVANETLRFGEPGDTGAFQVQGSGTISLGVGNSATTMTIQGNGGNVGIGTTTPSTRLSVVQNGLYPGINIEEASGTARRATIGFGVNGTTADTGWIMGQGLTNDTTKNFYLNDLTAGVTRLLIDTAGNIGIGTTSPTQKLQVAGTVGVTGAIANGVANSMILANTGSGESQLWALGPNVSTPGTFKIVTGRSDLSGSQESVVVSQTGTTFAGNVGIGTTNPGTRLDIRGPDSLPVYVRSDDVGSYMRFLTSNTVSRGAFGYSANGAEFINGALNTVNMTILDGGNVGIGTVAPLGKLTVNTAINTPMEVTFAGSATGDYTGIRFASYVATDGFRNGGIFYERVNDGSDRGKLHFALDSTLDATNLDLTDSKMAIDYNGNVGIGTTTPGAKLLVTGEIRSYDTFPAFSLLQTNNIGVRAVMGNDGKLYFQDTTNAFSSTVNNILTMVTGSGNVGIGTTSPAVQFEVQKATTGVVRTSAAQNPTIYYTELYGNWDSANLGGVRTSQGNLIRYDSNNGSSQIGVGDVITVKNSGNVGIGTTNPISPLQVNGNLTVGSGVASSSIGSIQLLSGGVSPIANRLTYGTDGTGWKFAIGKNQSGVISDQFVIQDNGNVGIGTSTPGNTLTVGGSTGIAGALGITGQILSTDTSGNFITNVPVGTGPRSVRMGNSGNDVYFGTEGSTPGAFFTGSLAYSSVIYSNTAVQTIIGGAPRMIVNTSGNVGIGTTNPGTKLEISGANAVQRFRQGTDDAGLMGIDFAHRATDTIVKTALISEAIGTWGRSNLHLVVDTAADSNPYTTGADTKLFISGSTGNVGIGTTNPSTQLHLASAAPNAGGLLIESTSGTSGGIADIELRGRRDDTNGSTPFGGSLYLSRIYTPGNMVAGVNDTFSQLGNILFGGNAGGTTAASIVYPASMGGIVEGTFTSSSSASTGLVFRTGAVGQAKDTVNAQFGTERMRITSTGNVGIGTTTPGAKLQIDAGTYNANNRVLYVKNSDHAVVNTGYDTAVIQQNDAPTLRLVESGENLSTTLSSDAGVSTLSSSGILRLMAGGTYNSFGFSGMGGNLGLAVAANGNVGIGTTTPGNKLTVLGSAGYLSQFTDGTRDLRVFTASGYSALGSENSGDDLRLYVDGNSTRGISIKNTTGNVGIGTTDPFSSLAVYGDATLDSAGSVDRMLYFRNQSTVGTIQSDKALRINTNNTEALRILMNGNVGIGTTNPGSKLEVVGDIRFSGDLKTAAISKITPIFIRGTGYNNVSSRQIKIGNTNYASDARGLLFTIVNKATHAVVSTTNYDTYGSSSDSDSLATALNALTNQQIGILVSYDAWEGNHTANLKAAFLRLGLMKAYHSGGSIYGRTPYAAIFEGGSSGVTSSKAVEVQVSSPASQVYADISGWIMDGSYAVTPPTGNNTLYNPDGTIPALTVDGSGFVGVGTTTPIDKLQVDADNTIFGRGEFMGSNLLYGGDAEDIYTTAWVSRDFGIDGSSGAGSYTASGAFSGTYSFAATNDGGFNQAVSVVPGAVYTLSMRMRVNAVNNPDASQGYAVVGSTATGRDIADKACNPNDYDVSPNLNKWVLCSVTFTAPAASDTSLTTVYVGARALGSTHSVLFDNVTLVRGGLVSSFSPLSNFLGTGNSSISGNLGVGTSTPFSAKFIADGGVSQVAGLFSTQLDTQIRLHSTNSWAGIGFDDGADGNDFLWFNGTNSTFAIGGAGANVANKKLHIDGGTTIGANYDAVANPTNGLYVEGQTWLNGNVGIGTTTPGTKLHVVGNSSYTGFGGGQFKIGAETGQPRWTEVGYNTSTNVGFIQAGINGGALSNFIINPDGGNVGIGTAPFSVSTKLSVNGDLTLAGGSTLGAGTISANQIGINVDLTLRPGATSALRLQNWNGSGWGDGIVLASSTLNVGIGTSTPGSRLDVWNATSTSNIDVFRIGTNVGSTNNIKFRIDSDGDVFTDGGTTIGTPADLAENYPALEALDAGTVVAFGSSTVAWEQADDNASSTQSYDISGVQKATNGYEAVGVVSTKAGITLGGNTTNGVPVAFAGRVPVKVTTENGEVKRGDYLTVSNTIPGYAMKLTGEGKAIGRVLSDYAQGNDKVMMLVENGYQKLNLLGTTASTTGMLTTGNVDLNANGVAIYNIKSLASANGTWSIDEHGRIVATTLCIDGTCLDGPGFKDLVEGNTGGSKHGAMHIIGAHAFLLSATTHTLRVLDIAAGDNPVIVASLTLPEDVTSLSANGTYLYINNSDLSMLYIVDVSSPTQPTLLRSVNTGLATEIDTPSPEPEVVPEEAVPSPEEGGTQEDAPIVESQPEPVPETTESQNEAEEPLVSEEEVTPPEETAPLSSLESPETTSTP